MHELFITFNYMSNIIGVITTEETATEDTTELPLPMNTTLETTIAATLISVYLSMSPIMHGLLLL